MSGRTALPEEGGAKSVKCFERFNGLDTFTFFYSPEDRYRKITFSRSLKLSPSLLPG